VVAVEEEQVDLALTEHLHQQQPATVGLDIHGHTLVIFTLVVGVDQEVQQDHHLPQEVQEDLVGVAMV
jgi:hypothetical protein